MELDPQNLKSLISGYNSESCLMLKDIERSEDLPCEGSVDLLSQVYEVEYVAQKKVNLLSSKYSVPFIKVVCHPFGLVSPQYEYSSTDTKLASYVRPSQNDDPHFYISSHLIPNIKYREDNFFDPYFLSTLYQYSQLIVLRCFSYMNYNIAHEFSHYLDDLEGRIDLEDPLDVRIHDCFFLDRAYECYKILVNEE